MNDYLTFEGQVVPLEWSKSTYTILPLPDNIAEALRKLGAKRVEGEINDQPVNLALTTAPVFEGTFLWAGKTLLADVGIVPGDVVEVRLRKANDDQVDTPADVTAALNAADAMGVWMALTPGKRRGLLYSINGAKRAATRANRIQKMIADLT